MSKILKCIDINGVVKLTHSKHYKMITEGDEYFEVFNDVNNLVSLYKRRFIDVTRELKIKSLL